MVMFFASIKYQFKIVQYNTSNVKSISQLNKSKSWMKKVTLNISSSMFGDSNDETTFSHKSLLANIHVSSTQSFCK